MMILDNFLCWFFMYTYKIMGFLGGTMVKNLPAMWESGIRSGGEGPLEKRVATHFGILVWRIPCTEEPGGLQSMGSES